MSWHDGNRDRGLPPDWPQLRAAVIRRDGGCCVWCGQPGSEVDHIGRRDVHEVHNLRLLCAPCHRRRTSRQGGKAYQAALKAAKKRLRREEPHPGRIG